MRRSYWSKVREWWSQYPKQEKQALAICGGFLAFCLTIAGATYMITTSAGQREREEERARLRAAGRELQAVVEQYDCRPGLSRIDAKRLASEMVNVVPEPPSPGYARLYHIADKANIDDLLSWIPDSKSAAELVRRFRNIPPKCLVDELEQRVESYDSIPGLSFTDQVQLGYALGWGPTGIPKGRTLEVDKLSKLEMERALQSYRSLSPRPPQH